METQKKGNGFTLVELIVVITILAILGTIAIMAFEGYSKNARDSARLSDISSMKKALELWILQSGSYPEPTTPTNITYSGAITWTQGTYGATVHQTVGKLDKKPTDPLYDTDYTYSVTTSKKEYQLGAVIEGTIASLPTIHQTYAATESKEAFVSGNYNGVVTSTQTGGIYYILAVPSIILSDINDTDLIGTKQFVLHKKSNLPHSYANKSLTMTGVEVDFNPVVVWSGTGYVKLNNQTEFETLVSNLQAVYNSGSLFASLPEYSNIATTGVYSVPAMNAIKSIVQVNLKQELEDVNVVSQNVVPQNGGSGGTPTAESYFTFDPGSGTITRYNNDITTSGVPTNVVIPSTIGGVPVTRIGYEAFKSGFVWNEALQTTVEYLSITSVEIPNSVTSIQGSAFRSNQISGTLNIPNSVTTIGSSAFRSNSITSVIISNSVTSIGMDAFRSNQIAGTLSIPNSVTNISSNAFSSNQISGTLNIPNSVTNISSNAFDSNLITSAIIPDSVSSFGDNVFANNPGISILDSTLAPKEYFFMSDGGSGVKITKYIGSSTTLTIPSTLGGNPVTVIGDSVFGGKGLTSVSIPNSVTIIGGGAFDSNSLTSITLPPNLTTIDGYAFAYNGLTSVTFPSSVTSITWYAFANNKLTSVTIPSSVTSMDGNVFNSNGPLNDSGNITDWSSGNGGTWNISGTSWVKQ